jgi:AcrR family transcriptional regulator
LNGTLRSGTFARVSTTPLSGRRAQAARNDERILEAAREVFLADPEAPIAAVAHAAGVGIGALYRRYANKDALLQRLAGDGLRRYLEETEAALADDGDAWEAFAAWMARCVDAGTSSLTQRLAGAFPATDELRRDGARAAELTRDLLERTRAAGGLRAGIEVGDLSLLFEQLQAIRIGDAARTAEVRRRHLAVVLDGLRTPGTRELPGPAPQWAEITARYEG